MQFYTVKNTVVILFWTLQNIEKLVDIVLLYTKHWHTVTLSDLGIKSIKNKVHNSVINHVIKCVVISSHLNKSITKRNDGQPLRIIWPFLKGAFSSDWYTCFSPSLFDVPDAQTSNICKWPEVFFSFLQKHPRVGGLAWIKLCGSSLQFRSFRQANVNEKDCELSVAEL